MSIHQSRAVVVTRHGGPGVLAVQSREVGDPGPGQVLVRPAATGVNFIDVYDRQGIYPGEPPFVLGREGAGTVLTVGTDVSDIAEGDVVAWATWPGSHSELVLLDADRAVPVPAALDPGVAAAAMLQGMTAHYLVTATHQVRPGDSVLVHAAAGGVGQLLVQWAARLGAHVIGTVSTEEKEAIARAAGAHEIVRYTEVDDVAAAVRDANGGRGVTVVYDGVGKTTFDASLAALAPRGMLVVYGGASGQVPPFDIQRLNAAGSLFLTRPTLMSYTASREELLHRGGAVLDAVAAGELQIAIGGRYSFDDAAQAYTDLEGRVSTGKLLLVP